jgi:RNA recognition motif-containing protein
LCAADFRKYFAQFGKVVSAEVMFNRETNKSRGFGFVVFDSETCVEVVLQEKNHVIDGKSVEVKRAVPRTDVPPPRSVSSRAGSFGGPGPGSIGSLDDLNSSTATTPPVSLSGSVPSTSSLANHPLESSSSSIPITPSKTRSSAANLMTSGTLVGYAAAVRYGSRGVPKPMSLSSSGGIPSSVGSPSPPSRNGHDSSSLRLDSSTMDGVADALSSLVLGDSNKPRSMNGGAGSIASPLHSASSSSLGSLSDKLPVSGTASNGGLSPLDVALSPLSDPVMEQWKLSPASTARGSTDLTSLSASEASYLSHGLLDDDVSIPNGSQLSWQAPSWQQPWHSPPLHHRPPTASDGMQQPPLPPAPQSLYSMFSSSSSSGPSWHNGYGEQHNSHAAHVNGSGASSDGFGSGMIGMGMGLPVDSYGGAFGMHEGEARHDAAAYSSLGGLLSQDYLSSSSSHQKHGVFGAAPEAEDDHRSLYEKNDQDLAYDLPASAAEYHRQFR